MLKPIDDILIQIKALRAKMTLLSMELKVAFIETVSQVQGDFDCVKEEADILRTEVYFISTTLIVFKFMYILVLTLCFHL